jgi:hypothetical protein
MASPPPGAAGRPAPPPPSPPAGERSPHARSPEPGARPGGSAGGGGTPGSGAKSNLGKAPLLSGSPDAGGASLRRLPSDASLASLSAASTLRAAGAHAAAVDQVRHRRPRPLHRVFGTMQAHALPHAGAPTLHACSHPRTLLQGDGPSQSGGGGGGGGGGGSDNIKVVVRVRPLFPPETAKGAANVVSVAEDCSSMKVRAHGGHAGHAARHAAMHALLCRSHGRVHRRDPRSTPPGHCAGPWRRQHAARVRLPRVSRPRDQPGRRHGAVRHPAAAGRGAGGVPRDHPGVRPDGCAAPCCARHARMRQLAGSALRPRRGCER